MLADTAVHELGTAGAQFVLCGADKRAIAKGWPDLHPSVDEATTHLRGGGLIGLVPASIGAVVVDFDDDDADKLRTAIEAIGVPACMHPTRQPGRRHLWYRHPAAKVGNRKWAHGDVRGDAGYAILWHPDVVAEHLDRLQKDPPLDLAKVPPLVSRLPVRPITAAVADWTLLGAIARVRDAENGTRNETLNREAFQAALHGENMALLRTAAVQAGLSVAEVSATIASAEAGGRRQVAPVVLPAPPGASRRPPKGGIDAGEAALSLAPGWKATCMYVEGRGWFLRVDTSKLWRPGSTAELHGRLQATPVWDGCKRGTRTGAIEAELTGQLHVDGDLLDADGWTAGLPDGRVLNLRDGTVRAPVPGDLITMKLGAVPDASGPPAVWLRFLGEALEYADDIDGCCRYLRWWIRSALTGDVSAHRMIFLHGQSGTGKNTLADLVLHLAGDYGAAVAAAHVVSKRQEHRQWLAKLAGRRFALVGDLPTGGVWSADLQDLVGGATIEANLMRSNSIEFKSRVHVMATGNASPTGQAGIWRRLVQFELRHKPTDADKDTGLPAKLHAEAGRILHWALTGDVDEPPMPAELAGAAEAVRDEQNPVAAWIREAWHGDPYGRTPTAEMYSAYLIRFADVPDRDQLTDNRFGRLLTAEFGPSIVRDGVKVRKCVEYQA